MSIGLSIKKKSKIDSLQGYRTLAFLLIFISHADIVATGALGVSIFIVLSGFLMGISYTSIRIENMPTSFKGKVKFSFGKVAKLFPLHLITFFIMLGFTVVTFYCKDCINHETILYLIISGIFNVLMLQSWIPIENYYFSFNKVSWYLGICTFSYFLFPCIARTFEKIFEKSKKMIIYYIVIIISMMFFVPLSIAGIASSDFVKWLTYICPVYRVCDFVFGFLLGGVIRKSKFDIINLKNRNSYLFYSLYEIIWCIFLFIWIWIYLNGDLATVLRYDIFWLPLSLSGVLFFYVGEGCISNLFRSRIFVLIGDMTPQAFLIHQIAIGFVNIILDNKVIVVIVSLGLTLVGCVIWDRLYTFFLKH